MNCPRCGEDWSDVAVVRNAKREALAPTPPDALREAAEQYREAVRRRDPEAMQHIANRIVYRLILDQPKEADRA